MLWNLNSVLIKENEYVVLVTGEAVMPMGASHWWQKLATSIPTKFSIKSFTLAPLHPRNVTRCPYISISSPSKKFPIRFTKLWPKTKTLRWHHTPSAILAAGEVRNYWGVAHAITRVKVLSFIHNNTKLEPTWGRHTLNHLKQNRLFGINSSVNNKLNT